MAACASFAKLNSLSSPWISNNSFSSRSGSSSLLATRRVSLPIRATSYSDELVKTAKTIASPGRGILAIDESNATCGKRLASIGLDNTEVNRQAYRQLLLTTPGLGEYISGSILFEETLYQSTTDGKKFVDCLREENIVPGIKVDKGLVPLPGSNNESWCQGLDGLASRSAEYYKQGARFAKWQTVVSIPCGPSALAVKEAAWGLARYAAISQDNGLVPIVEPKILLDGDHPIERTLYINVISNLCYIYRAARKQESMRLTAGSCLVRLVRFNHPSIQLVAEKLSFKDLASSLVKGSPREQQVSLNLLNMAMLGSHMLTNIGRYLIPLAEDKNLIPSLLSLVEQGSEILKGKALFFVALLCKHGRRWLPHFFCSQKLLSVVDRLGKEKDTYVRQCLDAFVNIVASTIPGLLDIITGDIQQMMGGRRHGHISALTSRSAPKTNIHLFPVVLHLVSSSTFKHKVVTIQVLRQLANLIKLIETPFQGRDDFQITLLRILESVTEDSRVLFGNPDIFIREILPSLTVLYKGNKDGDARFLCLKIFFDAMIILLSEPIEEEQRLKDLKFISNTRFLPLYPTFIEDEDPIPIFAQRLLVMLLEFSFITIPDILHLKIISQCFEFLLGDLSNANVNNVKLCLALASAPEMETKLLSQLKVVRRIGNFLEFVCAKEMEDLLEPTLGLCMAFLARSVTCGKEPTLLGDCPPEVSGVVDPQQCIRDIMDFGSNVGVMLALSASAKTNIADIASKCVVLLLKAAPREATTGLLTNLPKVSVILESWNRGISHLIVQRMLHALGYACKQYLLHAMILSISMPEISRIEVIVSELKSSGVPGLAKTAALAALELQRLPRCI